MTIVLEGILTEDDDGNICSKHQISGDQTFIIEIRSNMTNITFFDGSSFQCNIDYQKELYYCVGLKPAEYQLEVDGNITIVEIDLPSPDCKFRLETGKNNYCWAGLESSNSRYLKRYPLFL